MEFISSDKETLRIYQMRKMALSDYTSGINHAKRETATEIAKNLLKMGLSLEQISEGTGLSIEIIKKLRDD